MAESADAYDSLMKWHIKMDHSRDGNATGIVPNDRQLEMAALDGQISTVSSSSVADDQSYMFISDTSQLHSLGDGIFGSESLTDGSAKEHQSTEMMLGTGGHTGLPANTAELSPNATVNANEKSDNPHPLGSSRNPIRIIQQGNKYTSMQELSPEQLNQIMQVRRGTEYCTLFVSLHHLQYALHNFVVACMQFANFWPNADPNRNPNLSQICKQWMLHMCRLTNCSQHWNS